MPLLDYMQGRKLLEKHGIRSVESRYVTSAEDAAKFANGGRIVLKLLSGRAIHKTKAGLVKLDLDGSKEMADAYNDLIRKGKKLRPYSVLAQKMAPSGIEMIVGGKTDAQFGAMLLIGLGGIYVEAFKDVQLRLCPITRADALDMLSELKSGHAITYDGKAEDMIVKLMLRVSDFLTANKRIKELDLNPVIVRPDSYDVVDIRIIG